MTPSFRDLYVSWVCDPGRPCSGRGSRFSPAVWVVGAWRALFRLDAAYWYEPPYKHLITVGELVAKLRRLDPDLVVFGVENGHTRCQIVDIEVWPRADTPHVGLVLHY